ncbi:MAG TPA: DUF1775 domain-containing protein [Acidimicrobiales bacterium]
MTTDHRTHRAGQPSRGRPGRRGPIIALAGAVALLVAVATPAFAHVEAEGATDASGITTVTFAFTHGCTGSPTTALSIQLPDGTTEVTPQNPAGWTSTASATVLDWKGGSIPDAQPGEFVASMRIVGTKGSTVFLPTKQICAVGEEDWLEKTADPEADNAAPRIVLTETVAPDATATTKATTTTTKASTTGAPATTSTAASGPASDDTKNNVGALVGAIAVLIIAGGALILYLRNRRPKTPPTATGTPGTDTPAPGDTPPSSLP